MSCDMGLVMQAQTANATEEDLRSALPTEPTVQRGWQPALLASGLWLTAAWIGLLAYGFIKLIAHAV